MKQRIQNGANLLENHVFQFDFLNDPLLDETDKNGNVTKKSKLPDTLQDIIRDPEKRRKLVVYINPPYAEAANRRTVVGTGDNRKNISVTHTTYKHYLSQIGIAGRELYAQFLIRISTECNGCLLASFTTLKYLNSYNFRKFREYFTPQHLGGFICPAYTFDNVRGEFPIGFNIWDTGVSNTWGKTTMDVFDKDGNYMFCAKSYYCSQFFRSINDWIITTRNRDLSYTIGFMSAKGSDFQNQDYVFIINDKKQLPHPRGTEVSNKNICEIAVYYTVRHIIDHTWLNHDDQFLYPNDGWQTNQEFQTDCLVYTLFHGQNRISSEHGSNHWIPFTEDEVGAQEKFESHFMSDYLKGKHTPSTSPACTEGELFAQGQSQPAAPAAPKLQFSAEAQAVLDAGRELWRYYHRQPIAKERPNASFYDIRLYFQGIKTTKSGKQQMNTESQDATYTSLIANLRQKQKELAKKVEPKVYEYGFLKK